MRFAFAGAPISDTMKQHGLNLAQASWFLKGAKTYGQLPIEEQIAIAKDRAHTAAVTKAAKGGFFTRLWKGVKKVATWAYKVAKVAVGVAAYTFAAAHPFLGGLMIYGAVKVMPFVKDIPVVGDLVKWTAIGATAGVGVAVGKMAYGWLPKIWKGTVKWATPPSLTQNIINGSTGVFSWLYYVITS